MVSWLYDVLYINLTTPIAPPTQRHGLHLPTGEEDEEQQTLQKGESLSLSQIHNSLIHISIHVC